MITIKENIINIIINIFVNNIINIEKSTIDLI